MKKYYIQYLEKSPHNDVNTINIEGGKLFTTKKEAISYLATCANNFASVADCQEHKFNKRQGEMYISFDDGSKCFWKILSI